MAWAAESLAQCLALAKASAEVTHNHPDGIAGACVVAGAVYLARTGADKAAIRDHVTRYYPLDFTLDAIRDDLRLRRHLRRQRPPGHGGLPGGRGL